MSEGLTKEDRLDNKRLFGAFSVCLEERRRMIMALEWIVKKAKRTGQNQIAVVAQQALDGEEPNPLREANP